MIEPLRWPEPPADSWDGFDDEPPVEAYDGPSVMDDVKPSPGDRLRERLVPFDDMEQRPLPAYLVDNTLVEGSLAAIWGNPGGGKSFTALDIAACVATGSWWQGER